MPLRTLVTDFRPISEFAPGEIWVAIDGREIPFRYMSDTHLENAIYMVKSYIAGTTLALLGCSKLAANDLLGSPELEETLSMLMDERERRNHEGITISTCNNPYYWDERRQ